MYYKIVFVLYTFIYFYYPDRVVLYVMAFNIGKGTPFTYTMCVVRYVHTTIYACSVSVVFHRKRLLLF
jgi:hypothetical protein